MEQTTTLIEQINHNRYQHPERAKEACLTLLQQDETQAEPYQTAFAHTHLADYFMQRRHHEECLTHLKAALQIAEEHAYFDLLALCYNIGGIYYNSHFDEITAIKYYLDAYNLAMEINHLDDMMMTLNNIAAMFSQKEDYQEALHYLQRAYQIFQQKGDSITSQRDLIVILNLVQMDLLTHSPDDARMLYQRYEQSIFAFDEDKLSKHIILLCQLYLAQEQGNREQVFSCADQFLQESYHTHPNRTMYFSFYSDIFDVILKNRNKKRAELLLQIMGEICLEDDIEQQLKLHLNWIHFAETFHLEESLIQAYKQYYLLQKLVTDSTNRSKAKSMKEKILMNHMIKEKEIMEQEKRVLEAKIKIDELTGLFNRRYFRTLADSMRENSHVREIGYIVADIDYFKEYNDLYGHYQGDQLLRSVAQCLDEYGDSRFFVARYGGDEFACLCVNVCKEEIEQYLKQVYQTLESLHIEHRASLVSNIATISAGYTVMKKDEHYQYETALIMADTALYQAKKAGRALYRSI